MTANTVYRDYVTDGVPSSGINNPLKSAIRVLLSGYEAMLSDHDEAIASLLLDVSRTFGAASVAALKATPSPASGDLRYMSAQGREGHFVFVAGDFSAKVAADPASGVYAASDSVAASAGAWVRIFSGDLVATWFGLSTGGSGSNNALAINRAITLANLLSCGVMIPGGQFDISVLPGDGIKVMQNTRLYGVGKRKSILNLVGASTLAQLTGYTGGSGIGRAYTPGVANPRISNVLIEQLAVTLNHPSASISSSHVQIGVDFRHLTRSIVRDCYIGNYHPIDDAKGIAQNYLAQGYGVVCGNVSAGDAGYCGGEVNLIRDNFIAGCYRGVTIDDNILSPVSAAYQTSVIHNDIQVCHLLIGQISQYGAACVFRDNTLQALIKPAGNTNDTMGINIAGYGNIVDEPYGEYGADCQSIIRFAPTARRNRVRYSGVCSATGGITNAFQDNGGASSYNIVEYFANTGAAGTWNSQGAPMRMISGTSTAQT